jgi:hypothetical protein
LIEPLIPDAEQQRDIERIASEPTGAALDCSTPGSGKTLVALSVAALRGAQQVLVIAPLGTRLGWQVTAQRIGLDLPFRWVTSTDTRKNKGVENRTMLEFGEPGLYFIGPEYATQLAWNIMRDAEGTPLRNEKGKIMKRRNEFWANIHPDMLIVDEVHEGTANARSLRHKVYAQLRAGFRHWLSGTPHGNEFSGIYPVTKVIWPDHVPATVGAFQNQYVAMEYDPWSRWNGTGEYLAFKRMYCPEGRCKEDNHLHGVPGHEKEPGAYFASLPCVVRREWEYDGVIDEQTVYVELSAAQRKLYIDLEERMATMLEEGLFTVDYRSTIRVRLRQATLGVFKTSDEGKVTFDLECKSTKLDALHKVMRDDFEGESALVFTDSKEFAYVMAHRTPGAEVFTGDQSQAKRDEIRARFASGATKYLIMVVKAGSTGLDQLQHATRNLVWVSRDDSRIKNEQGTARIVRRGQGELVRIRHLLAPETYDIGMLSDHMERAILMRETMRLDK